MSHATEVPDSPTSPRRLVLVRHAKAVSDSGGSDRARQLTALGRKDAARLGRWLEQRLPRIDAVWSSSAVRADQTCAVMAAHASGAPLPELLDALYDAGPDDLLEMVRAADDRLGVVLVVGHNPTIERLAAWLSGDDRGFPTCAAAIIEVPGSWADLQPGGARLVDFTVP